jgi:hypothetical protein
MVYGWSLCLVWFMEWHLISFNISGSLFVVQIQNQKSFVSTRVIHDDDKWFWEHSFRKFYSGWAIDKYFTKSLVWMIWLVSLETETTNLRCWSSLKPREFNWLTVLKVKNFHEGLAYNLLAFYLRWSSPSLLLFCLNINTIRR